MIKDLKTKELTILILPLLLTVSIFSFNQYIQSIKDFTFVYLDRYIFLLVVAFITLYAINLFKIIDKKLSYNPKIKFLNIILNLLLIYSVSVFIHPLAKGVFFLNMLLINLGVSFVFSLFIAFLIKLRFKTK